MAFERAQVTYGLAIVGDGLGAMDYLKGRGKYCNRNKFPFPKLVLLDLGMPGVGGFQMLEQLQEDPELSGLPVMVLSGSSYLPDVQRAYELGAKSFLEKPSDLGKFAAEVKRMLDRLPMEPGSEAA